MGLWSFPVYYGDTYAGSMSGSGDSWEGSYFIPSYDAGSFSEYENIFMSGFGGGGGSGGLSISRPNGSFGQYRRHWSGHGKFLHGTRAFFSWLFSGISWEATNMSPGDFEVGPVIDPSDFVSGEDDCGNLVSKQLRATGDVAYDYSDAYDPQKQFFDYSKILSFFYFAEWNVYRKKPGPTSNDEIRKGTECVVNQIDNGHAVKAMVNYSDHGVYDGSYTTGNPDGSDHSISIVGYGMNDGNFYFRFFDNATSNHRIGTHPSNRLYCANQRFMTNQTAAMHRNNTFIMGGTYILTHIRFNKP